jgi:hypothetical protein
MLSNHGKQYKKNIEAMTNQRIDELNYEYSDVSSSIFNVVTNLKNKIYETTSFVDRNELSHVDNSNNIYTGEVFKDICSNYFYVNLKAVLKQFNFKSNKIVSLYNNNRNKDFFKYHNLSYLNPYDKIPIMHNNKLYNLIKGTNIKQKINNDPSNFELAGNCFSKKHNKTFHFDKKISNVSSSLKCKQLSIDNYYKHFILQQDTDGSLNCYLSNDINTTTDFDISLNGCNQKDNFKLGFIENSGLSVNNSYGIYTNGSNPNYAQDEFIDFEHSIIQHHTFASLGNDVSCNTIINDPSLYGYVQNINDNKCYSVNNNVILDPAQRLYDQSFNIIMKSLKKKTVIEPFRTKNVPDNKLNEILIPIFTLRDILNQPLYKDTINDIELQKKQIVLNSNKIYKEFEKYNKIIRQKNLDLSQDISLKMNFVTNAEHHLNNDFNLDHIDEIKRKLHDNQLILAHEHHMYILWTILGVSTLLILLKYSNPIN